MKEILLIDGSSLLTTNFYGTLDTRYYSEKTEEGKQIYLNRLLKTSDGKTINGVFGMVRALEKVLSKKVFNHIVIAWDKSRDNTFRRQLYPLYKAQRGQSPRELGEQFYTAQSLFEEIGIKQFAYDSYEADDIIGTFAKNFPDISTYIWTKDQDLLQLADPTTKIWLITKKNKEMMEEIGIDIYMQQILPIPTNVFEHTQETVKEFYSLYPQQIIDLKALEGDPSDNIPGVKGVGKKTIIPLLQEFEDVEGIYDFLENETEKEIKSLCKDLGIRSPLNKMMYKITKEDIRDELLEMILQRKTAEINELLSINLSLKGKAEILSQTTLEDIIKNKVVKKDILLKPILAKVGTYQLGDAYEASKLFKVLTTIKTDIPELINLTLTDIQCDSRLANRKEVYKKYEFNSLV